jgi:argininosuccinate lyase
MPVSLAHLLLAWANTLLRGCERLEDFSKRLDSMPLGSGAVAGSSLGLDRGAMLDDLPFTRLSTNSMDAVSTRDFLAEFMFIGSCVMVDLSRMAEDLIVYSSDEFGFIDLPDELCTTSSLMPQKKNPDALELIRGKSSRAVGNLTGLLMLMKGLPYTYDRDLQEDKKGLFETADDLRSAVPVMRQVIEGFIVNRGRIESMLAGSGGLLFATDLADYLVEKGVPFREAHRTVGSVVRHAVDTGTGLADLDLQTYRKFSQAFGGDLYQMFDFRRSVDRHDVAGGTALNRIDEEILRIEKLV